MNQLEKLQEKFKNTNYLLYKFTAKNMVNNKVVESEEYGILNLDLPYDWKSIHRELKINSGHKLVGANLPDEKVSRKIALIAREIAGELSDAKEIAKLTPAEIKTEEKVEEVKAKIKAKE